MKLSVKYVHKVSDVMSVALHVLANCVYGLRTGVRVLGNVVIICSDLSFAADRKRTGTASAEQERNAGVFQRSRTLRTHRAVVPTTQLHKRHDTNSRGRRGT